MFARPLNDLPALNAGLNALSTILLVSGWILIRKGLWRQHAYCMAAALVTSALFLTSYLYYHYSHGHTTFVGPAAARAVYLCVLIPHIILAVVMVPFILKLVYHAARRQWDRHRRTARYTLPVWLYVSVTGVIVYVMLYQIYMPGKS
jgi:uncharacterized membrane protein YozB (DUF420 family)